MSTLTEAERAELQDAMNEAAERHIRHQHSIIDGYASFILDRDLPLPPWGKLLKAGAYYVQLPESGTTIESGTTAGELPPEWFWVWGLTLDEIEENEAGEGEIRMHLTRIDLRESEPLNVLTMWLWLAVNDAREDGDTERVERLLHLASGLVAPDKSDINATLTVAIPKQDTNPVRSRVDPIGKLANKITDPVLFTDGGVDLIVSGKREHEVTTWVSLTSEDLSDVDTHGHTITEIDREIMNAVASHWKAGNQTVTLSQIAKATGFRKPSKAKLASVEAEVDALARIWVDVDASAELRGKEIYDTDVVQSTKFGGHLLEVRKSEIETVNGRRVVGYQILRPPIILQHAALRGQLVTTPSRLMAVGTGSDTDANVVMRNRIITKIQRMKSDKKRSRRIRYVHSPEHPERAGLFEVVGVRLQDRDAKARAVEFARSCLQGLTDMGWISGFSEVRETGRGRPVVGVDITL